MNNTNFNQSAEKVNTCTKNFQDGSAPPISTQPNAAASASAALLAAFAEADLEDSARDGDPGAIAELCDRWYSGGGLDLLTETPNYSIKPGLAGINTDYSTYFTSIDGQTSVLVYGSKPSDAYALFDSWLEQIDEQELKSLDVDLAGHAWRFQRSAGGNYGYFAMITGSGLSIAFCRSPGKTSRAEIPLCKVVFGWQLANSANLADVMAKVFEYLRILGADGLRYHISRLDIQYTTNNLPMTEIERARVENRVVTRCRKPGTWGGNTDAAETYVWTSNKGGWILRIYNKTVELLEKCEGDKIEWLERFIPFYSSAWTRVEWELKRDFLRERGITTFDDLYNSWQSLTTYIMAYLVRFVDRDKGNHTERTLPADFWALIHQNITGAGEGCQPLKEKTKPSQAVKLDSRTTSIFSSTTVTFFSKLVASDAAINETSIEDALYNVFLRLKTAIVEKSKTITDSADVTWSGYSDFDQYAA